MALLPWPEAFSLMSAIFAGTASRRGAPSDKGLPSAPAADRQQHEKGRRAEDFNQERKNCEDRARKRGLLCSVMTLFGLCVRNGDWRRAVRGAPFGWKRVAPTGDDVWTHVSLLKRFRRLHEVCYPFHRRAAERMILSKLHSS